MQVFNIVKTFIQTLWVALIAAAVIFMPRLAYAAEITMGSNGNLVFEPNEISIEAGETITFVNVDFPTHNMVQNSDPSFCIQSIAFG